MNNPCHARLMLLTFLFIAQFFTFVAKADNSDDYILVKQILEKWFISPSDGYILDTCIRIYNYSENGTLKTIVDTPKSIFHAAYFAEFDTEGKIKSYKEYYDTLTNTTEFFWESGNKIRFERQWTEGQKTEVGTIIYYGKLKAVELPRDPGGWLIVMADSTQYLDGAGKIVSTWIWTYDSRGDVIKWESRAADANKLAYVAEYTYNYYDNGLIKWRSPSLDGIPVVFCFYEKSTKIQFHQKQTANKNIFTSQNPLSEGRYLINGRKIGKVTSRNSRKLPLMILIDSNQKKKLNVPVFGNKNNF